MQYTLRNVPTELDRALRNRARSEDKSLNQVALDVLMGALGLSAERKPQRDLSFLAGTWVSEPEVEQALEDQRRIDAELWE